MRGPRLIDTNAYWVGLGAYIVLSRILPVNQSAPKADPAEIARRNAHARLEHRRAEQARREEFRKDVTLAVEDAIVNARKPPGNF